MRKLRSTRHLGLVVGPHPIAPKLQGGARFWFVLFFFESRPLRVEHVSLHVKKIYIYICENIILITMIIIYYNDYMNVCIEICIYILHL